TNVANQLRPNEMYVFLRRRLSHRGLAKRRCRLRASLEHRVNLAQRVAIEAAADLVGISQRAVGLVLTQQQRAEMSSRPVGVAVAADRELPGQRTLDLQPIAAARPAIRRVAQF